MSSEPSKAAISKACELSNVLQKVPGFWEPMYMESHAALEAFAHYIDKVSEVAKRAVSVLDHEQLGGRVRTSLGELILEEPVDPLESVIEAMRSDGHMNPTVRETSQRLKSEIERRGGKIVWEAD